MPAANRPNPVRMRPATSAPVNAIPPVAARVAAVVVAAPATAVLPDADATPAEDWPSVGPVGSPAPMTSWALPGSSIVEATARLVEVVDVALLTTGCEGCVGCDGCVA